VKVRREGEMTPLLNARYFMRVFVAISGEKLDFDPNEKLKKLKTNLSKKELEFKFVPQENLHITLNFIGEISEDILPSIKDELSKLVDAHEGFDLKLSDLDAFPDIQKGRVMWIGVQNSIKLRSLQEDCEQRLRDLGLELEIREYRPHMTVARIRSPRNLKDVLSPYQGHKFGVMTVKSVVLYESKLGGAFPIYSKIEEFDLKGPAR